MLLTDLVRPREHPVYLVNATVVTPDETIPNGSVLIQDGLIHRVCPTSTHHAHEIDLAGHILMPGLVDIHCDAIEHEVMPRPQTFLPIDLAVRQADRLFAGVGVTTAFHSLSFWGEGATRGNQYNSDLARAVVSQNAWAIIDNRIHARFEITNSAGRPFVQQLVHDGTASLVSLMDHTPGQGQYPDEESYRAYARGTGLSEPEIDAILEEKRQAQTRAAGDVEALAETARTYGVPLASHDDDDPDRFPYLHRLGVTISEFPMNMPAAEAARDYRRTVLVGSPNVIRGQSGGVGPKAIDLIAGGYANALCSDYVPATFLPAVFQVHRELGWPLERAAQLGTLAPARAVGLADRGTIQEGQRADLILVELVNDWPVVRYLWSAGHLTFGCSPSSAPGEELRLLGRPFPNRT